MAHGLGLIDYDYYNTFNEIRRRKIDSRQLEKDYGTGASFRMNSTCPVVVRKGGMGFDEFAQELGFEGTDEFYDYIMNYKPMYKVAEEYRNFCSEFEEEKE